MLCVERGGPRRGIVPARRRRDVRGGLFDLIALLAVLALVALGALNLYSVAGWRPAVHQLEVVAASFALIALIQHLRVRRLGAVAWTCYGLSVLLPVAVLVVGQEANGARRWLALGPFTIQPSELAKLGLLLVLAWVLCSDGPAWRRLVVALSLAAVPIALTVVEPDLSTAALLTTLTVALVILSGVPLRLLLPVAPAAAVGLPPASSLLRPYQMARLRVFLAGATSAGGPGWAQLQAHIAVASGGLTGLSRAPVRVLLAQYLPGRQTDLAFASLVEQWGLLAGVAAVLAAVIVVWRLALASRVSRTRPGGLVCAGLAVLLGAQVVLSVGGNLGLLPIAGVPFPLVSYGGATAVVYLAALGIVLRVRHDGVRRPLWAPPRWRKPRPRWLRTAALGATASLLAFSAYGWDLQARGATLRQTGEAQMMRCIAIPAPRGAITDRHGAPLVLDVAQDDVVAVPGLLTGNPGALVTLAGLMAQPAPAIARALAGRNGFSVRLATVPLDTGARITAARLPGVLVIPSSRREYPYGPLLSPVLGFVGVATPQDEKRWPRLPLGGTVGRAGIEQLYDPELRGLDGAQCVYVDPHGRPVAPGPRQDPVPGGTLRLAIDLGLQTRLTAALADALRGVPGQPRGDLGAAVAMDPVTGEVLAMASLPSYPNDVYGPPVDGGALRRAMAAPGHPMLEHATQVVAPPGSSFKLVIAAADMVDPVFRPNQLVTTGGSFTYAGHTFANWRSFGPQNLVQAIAWSNDVYFYKLALALGPERISEVGRALGVGQPTGIDLPGESAGYLGTPQSVARIGAKWYGGSTVILGIGQGYVSVTPLQAARWTAALATGRLVTPRLGMASGAGAGVLSAISPPPSTRLAFESALGPVRQGMREAVLDGTAGLLAGLAVPAGAKTGTAQDPASPAGATDAWFLAAAPLDHPAIALASFVRGGGHGAQTSGPVASQTLEYFFAHQAQILGTAPRS